MAEKKVEIINRDASDKFKGFRYQKIRLAKKMLELIKENKNNNIIAFPELKDDSYFISNDGNRLLEQNKNYSKNFTFTTVEVRKSIVNFLDNYFEADKDPNIKFIFFTNVEYSHERKSEYLKNLNLEPLDNPLISYLDNKNFEDEVVKFISKIMLNTYIEEYKINASKEDTFKGYYRELVRWKKEDWCLFLDQVSFQFGEGNLEELGTELEKEIKESDFYQLEHVNKENLIKKCFLDTIDEKMTQKHFTQKMINVDTVKNIFYEVSSKDNDFKVDEIYIHWSAIEEEIEEYELRNVKEKIISVCSDFKTRTLKRYSREAITVRDEIKIFSKKQINSLKYRVYESMERFFDEEFIFKASYSFEELNKSIKELKEYVVRDINKLRTNFDYGIRNDITVQKLVLLLIDECFYSFDEE